MFPQRAAIGADDTFQAQAPSAQLLTGLPRAPQFTPDPAAGDAMRNRDWSGREKEMYYQMAQAPLPHQYTQGGGHPAFGAGSGTPVTQWLPQGQPTGFAARGGPTVYSNPGVNPGMVRPTYAYNTRLPGVQRGNPTMYAAPGTFPGQYYPGGSNTYIPSWEATGLIVKYTRNPSYFRINKYVKELKVPKDQGYYLTLGPDDPYRIVSLNNYLWEDSADAPGGRQERQAFGFQPFRTARYCYPFNLGQKSVQQAEWPILAEHAAMVAAKAMTARTYVATTLVTTTGNWSGTGFTNTGAASGAWTTSSVANNYIQNNINTAMIAIEQATGGIVTDEEALHITMNPTLARGVAGSPEYKQYIQGSPDALAAITDQRNPNRKYGLAPYLYGLGLVVENAIIVTTPKGANVTTPASQTRSYIWPTAHVVITSRPQGLVAEGDQTLDFSTVCFRVLENMTTESKTDPDNRREVGRVVDEWCVNLGAPQTGYDISGNS